MPADGSLATREAPPRSAHPYTPEQIAAWGLRPDRLPRHAAIIMDGNGRWALRKGWMRMRGHESGVAAVRAVTEEAARFSLTQLTLYAFSTENWRRPSSEVDLLMGLLARYVVEERPRLMANDIRLTTIGEIGTLPPEAAAPLAETIRLTSANAGLTLCLALNYGGRQEILHAVRRIAREVASGTLSPEAVDEAALSRRLYQTDMPPLDLLIRTAGEYRVSNFLLWQLSYAEIWTTEVLWPEFREADFRAALSAYAARERRFGAVPPDGDAQTKTG